MRGSSANARRDYTSVKLIESPKPWEAFLVPVSGFPVPKEELTSLRSFVERLTLLLSDQRRLSVEVFLLSNQLSLEDGAERLSSNAPAWSPRLGLGIWPDRPPPTVYTKDDFINLGPDEKPRTMMDQVLRISAQVSMRHQARNTMLGLGSVQQFMLADDVELLEKSRAVLLPHIQQDAFRNVALHIPMLEAKSFQNASSEQLDQWSCGASVYLRESPEDQGLLMASPEPMAPIFEHLGGQLEETGERSEWRLPSRT